MTWVTDIATDGLNSELPPTKTITRTSFSSRHFWAIQKNEPILFIILAFQFFSQMTQAIATLILPFYVVWLKIWFSLFNNHFEKRFAIEST